MKKLIILTAIFSLAFVTIKAQTAQADLLGTWKLISSVGKTDSGGGWNNDSTEINQVKAITPSRFMFTIYSKKTDSLLMSAQGPITVSGNKYTESLELTSNKGMLGKTYTYTSDVKGNRWRIQGGGNGFTLVEDWIKVE